MRDPEDYFLSVMRETFREAGVAVEGQALSAGDWPVERQAAGERELFSSSSAPLREILPGMMKEPTNSVILNVVGPVMRGPRR